MKWRGSRVPSFRPGLKLRCDAAAAALGGWLLKVDLRDVSCLKLRGKSDFDHEGRGIFNVLQRRAQFSKVLCQHAVPNSLSIELKLSSVKSCDEALNERDNEWRERMRPLSCS